MINLSLYEHTSTTTILPRLSKLITDLTTKSKSKQKNTKVKSMIKELQLRTLTPNQKQQFNRLLTRYTWI